MMVAAVMYPKSEKFDLDYYMASHIPLVQRLWSPLGLQSVQVLHGLPGPDGGAPTYAYMALLTFTTLEAFGQAAGKHGPEIFADIPNFTDAKPTIQLNETV
jgi:uncharacterized protein (TIGR02118 family)